jgi:hypothetical protein
MQSVEVKQKLQNFINHDYKDCSTAVEKLTSVLHDTALASAKFVKSLVLKRLNRSKKNLVMTSKILSKSFVFS